VNTLITITNDGIDRELLDEIRVGQKSTAFERLKDPSCKNLSFSVVYGLEYLDLIAESESQFSLWISALILVVSKKKEENNELTYVETVHLLLYSPN